MDRLTVQATTDATVLMAAIARLIDEDPVGTSVLATNAVRAMADPAAMSDAYWMWVADAAGSPVAGAMHTPPWPPHLATSDVEAAVALAERLAESGRTVTGVGGIRPAAEAFTRRWVELRPCRVRTARAEGVHEASTVTPPSGVPGTWRVSESGDAPLLNDWALGFIADIGDPRPARDDLLTTRAARGEMWLWEVGGTPVSMAYASPATGGVSRVSWVYTPPAHRKHGYASALVAVLTRSVLESGDRCMLYTDLANPTSNAIYQAVGYRRIADAVSLAFVPK
ncbi:MAG TPA: GNAT family N-acetyltransferase [Nocardioidaceae bacterium]|nr:GNAT family N-acetyltransferase [Nocardioidaceae bacterium]